MKSLFLFAVLSLSTLTMLGQEKLTTTRALYETPGLAPATFKATVQWEVHKDSLVMNYTKAPKWLNESGRTYVMPSKNGGNEYVFQEGNTRIKIVYGNKTVITIEEKDDFTGEIKKEMYF